MDQIITYLSFNGNCKEAMTFYQRCLGGELTLQTVGDSPAAEMLPEEMKLCILEAVLRKGSMVLKGTDMVDKGVLVPGNTISLLLHCNDEYEMRTYYLKLAYSGWKTHPITTDYFGGLYGMLTDRYGFQWLLRCKS